MNAAVAEPNPSARPEPPASASAIAASLSDLSAQPSRALRRLLRGQPEGEAGPHLPESVLWATFLELRARGEDDATSAFLRSLKTLHRRRTMGSPTLPCTDTRQDEHKLVDDSMLGELWKAYKRCICAQRTGPASQLLRDIELRLCIAS